MSVSAAVEGLRGLSRLSPATVAMLIALALAVGSLLWPTTRADLPRVNISE